MLYARVGEPASIWGVHGAAGRSGWQCLARRVSLHAPWEAVEWATVPPGGLSGEHRHTRTEELYLILSGQGDITLNGRRQPVRPGHLVVTPVGTSHKLANTGDGRLDWHVIEVLSPSTWQTVAGGAEIAPYVAGGDPAVVDLDARGQVDARDYLSGPVRTVSLDVVAPGDVLGIRAGTEEHTVFVLSGGGTVAHDGAERCLEPGVGLTFPLGSSGDLQATEPLRLYHVAVAVDGLAPVGEAE